MPKFFGFAVLGSFLTGTAFSQNATFVLSGGGNPFTNHYSQYLQTRTLTKALVGIPSAGPVDVRFGAGNNEHQPTLLADVFRIQIVNGQPKSSLLSGVIPGNRPATKTEVVNYFDRLTGVLPEDTFFLFVSDHGMPNQAAGNYDNNCIDLWNYDAAKQTPGPQAQSCLSKNELKGMFDKIPARRKVFVMSQCFSGGFHQMSVQTKAGYPTADAGICGFTATTKDETASGCTPFADGPNYKGYERFFTQQFSGKDVVTGKDMPYQPKHGLKDAHIAASLEDTTKDMPMSTSDYFLMQWAEAALPETFAPRTQAATAAAVRTAILGVMQGTIPSAQSLGLPAPLASLWAEKVSYLNQTIALLGGTNATLTTLLRQGTVQEMLQAMQAADRADDEERRDNVRRVFLTRETLAGIVALHLMRDQTAITELTGLVNCESASL